MVGDLSLGGNLSFVGNLDFQWCWKLEILEWVASCDVQEAGKDPFRTEAFNSRPSVYISIHLQGKRTINISTLCDNINISIPQFIM
jgi:hypothetical protein